MLVYSFIVVNKNKNYCNLKDIDMSISLIEKFIILTEDIALPTKIFMGKKENLLKFILFVKYFFNVFVANLNLRKKCFSGRHAAIFFIMAYYFPIFSVSYRNKDLKNTTTFQRLIT